jgi:PPOX class probable F420-dependent enzyme
MSKPQIPEHIATLLAKPNPAVVATVSPSGAPITVATWYLWENGKILLNMDAGRKRLQHIRADPRISLTVMDSADWYRHVSLRGRVTSLEDDPDLVDIDRLARHYTGQQYPDRERPRVSGWVEIERFHTWNIE